MQISWKWLSEMVDLSGVNGPQGLADLLTSRGLEVEEVHPLGKGFDKVVAAQILERNPHPQADRLSLCKVSTGHGEPLQIVCGAQNMKAGDKVALAQIGADLPNGMKIVQSKIRGVLSDGMLCSEEELKLAESSEGILILSPSTELGKPLAEILGRDDTILSFKLTANRGDCLSHFGMAREVAAALGQKIKRPEGTEIRFSHCPISVHLDAGEAAPQFWGCYMENVKVGPSPAWLVKRLEALGSRSINNVVDATNLVLFELGHPVHAYDADLIKGNEIRVRMGRKGEQLLLLDDQTVELEGSELVIADRERAIGLAGVMGGGNSEVRDQSTRLFLECAEFSPVLVRKTAFKFQKRTEAAHRFERGVDPMGPRHAMERLAYLINQLAGGTIKAMVVSALPSRLEAISDPSGRSFGKKIQVNQKYFQEFLGMALTPTQVEATLRAHECEVEKNGDEWTVTPPSFRLDLNLRQDLAEEVVRSLGYDKIPSTVPPLSTQPTAIAADPASAGQVVIDRAKDALVQAGLMETLNLAFTSKAWLSEFGMDSGVKILNPLSEEFEFLVPSLLPGVIRNALDNWRHHFGSEVPAIRSFELRPTYFAPGQIMAKSDVQTTVEERWKLAIALSGTRFANGLKNQQGEVDFYDLKAVIEALFDALGTRGVRFLPLSASRNQQDPVFKLLHPGQSAEILAGNTSAGFFGLLHPGKAKDLKTRAPLWIAELDWTAISKLSRGATQPRIFKPWPSFPPMERDFALIVKNDVSADKITQLAVKAGKPLAKVAKIFDIYRGSPVPEGMTSVAVRVIFYDEGRSLLETETEAASARILEVWKKELGAELRS